MAHPATVALQFPCSGKLYISDPQYGRDHDGVKLTVEPGTYYARVEEGHLLVVHESYLEQELEYRSLSAIPVETGILGVFDYKCYPNDTGDFGDVASFLARAHACRAIGNLGVLMGAERPQGVVAGTRSENGFGDHAILDARNSNGSIIAVAVQLFSTTADWEEDGDDDGYEDVPF